MIKLGTLCPKLQRIADEMTADDAPTDLRGLSPAEQRAELESRGIEPTTDWNRERLRKQAKRQKARHWERRRARK
jgi:hypothetical protein